MQNGDVDDAIVNSTSRDLSYVYTNQDLNTQMVSNSVSWIVFRMQASPRG